VDQASFGVLGAHRDRALQVDHATIVDAHAGRGAVDQRRQHRQPIAQMIEIQHDARLEIAHHPRQATAADLHRHAPAEVGQHLRRQLGDLRGPVAAHERQVLQPAAGQLVLAQPGQRPLAGQRHARAQHLQHARVAVDAHLDLLGRRRLLRGLARRLVRLLAGGDVLDHRLGEHLLLGDGHWHPVQPDVARVDQQLQQGIQLGRLQHPAAPASQQQVGSQIMLLGLDLAGQRRLPQQRRQRPGQRLLLAAVGDEPFQPQPLAGTDEAIHHPPPAWAAGGRRRRDAGRARRHLGGLGRSGGVSARARQGDGAGGDMLAGADPAATIAVPLPLAGIQDDRGRHWTAGRADAQHDLVGILRFDGDAPVPAERHALRPVAGPAIAPDEGDESFG
jgi:hypothetical protein